MEEFRSKSCRDGRNMQIESYYGIGSRPAPSGMNDLRSYSVSYSSSAPPPLPPPPYMGKEMKMKKGKSSVALTSKSWSFNDPELQRKKRVAGYKVYAVEGNMKGSLRKSFRWIKERCNQLVNGW